MYELQALRHRMESSLTHFKCRSSCRTKGDSWQLSEEKLQSVDDF